MKDFDWHDKRLPVALATNHGVMVAMVHLLDSVQFRELYLTRSCFHTWSQNYHAGLHFCIHAQVILTIAHDCKCGEWFKVYAFYKGLYTQWLLLLQLCKLLLDVVSRLEVKTFFEEIVAKGVIRIHNHQACLIVAFLEELYNMCLADCLQSEVS